MSITLGKSSLVEPPFRLQALADLDARGKPLAERQAREFLGCHLEIAWNRLRRGGFPWDKAMALMTEGLMVTQGTAKNLDHLEST